ncbi:amidohydrolase family protein [Mycobacterium sp. NAZ190054]|uniref:amidohydrolase family protein n=1 Tax=Mycobacterium sp. NAZ190054 TaxID=1747766 RepID=UPI000793C19C|nr:amidohydrolase family protein [Mycobacterium sp. NAZ190054]KWX68485.1 hypothetical protein ASJ79_17570 [Mycobacterium sp. NAZ190054]
MNLLPDHYVLSARRAFTATGDTVIDDAYVEIRHDRIVSVGTRSDYRGDPRLPVYDYGDATILPGLIDTHCHITLSGDGKAYEEQVRDSDELMALIAVNNLQRHLSAGVTTLRDNGGRNTIVFAVRDAIDRGFIDGPRLLLAGRPITHSAGHFHWCNGVADSLDRIRAAVRVLTAEGADHIKIMASGGATAGNSPYYSSYTIREMQVAVETAHGLGRLTTAHCRSTTSIENAIDAGLDCIEHADFLVPGEPVSFGQGITGHGRMVYDGRVADKMLRAGSFVSYTALVGGYETMRMLRTKNAETAALTGYERAKLAELEAYIDMRGQVFGSMLSDGFEGRITLSTDAGPQDMGFGTLQHCVEFAVSAGMAPTHAIKAVTSVAARACGVAADVGTLEAGKLADIMVAPGDAVRDVSKLETPSAVYQGGRLVAPYVVDSGVHRRAVDFTERLTHHAPPRDWPADQC